jgi:hypothetical protein
VRNPTSITLRFGVNEGNFQPHFNIYNKNTVPLNIVHVNTAGGGSISVAFFTLTSNLSLHYPIFMLKHNCGALSKQLPPGKIVHQRRERQNKIHKAFKLCVDVGYVISFVLLFRCFVVLLFHKFVS